MPAKRPEAPTPIQVPPASASRGAAWRGAPGGARSAQSSEGRPSRSSRLAATTSGQRLSAWKASASVHTPGIYFFAGRHRSRVLHRGEQELPLQLELHGQGLAELVEPLLLRPRARAPTRPGRCGWPARPTRAARRGRSCRGRPPPAPSRGPSPGRWCGRGRGRGSTSGPACCRRSPARRTCRPRLLRNQFTMKILGGLGMRSCMSSQCCR